MQPREPSEPVENRAVNDMLDRRIAAIVVAECLG
jgi:hypothetical protein